jgi:hypothetical protein
VSVMEVQSDSFHDILDFLRTVYSSDSDEFDVNETVRVLLDRNWLLDLLPSKRKAARRVLYDSLVGTYPFTKVLVDSYVLEVLGADPEAVPAPRKTEESDESGGSESSEGSDIESRGSIDDFVVDSESEDKFSSASESLSESRGNRFIDDGGWSEDELRRPPKKKSKKRKLSSCSRRSD